MLNNIYDYSKGVDSVISLIEGVLPLVDDVNQLDRCHFFLDY